MTLFVRPRPRRPRRRRWWQAPQCGTFGLARRDRGSCPGERRPHSPGIRRHGAFNRLKAGNCSGGRGGNRTVDSRAEEALVGILCLLLRGKDLGIEPLVRLEQNRNSKTGGSDLGIDEASALIDTGQGAAIRVQALDVIGQFDPVSRRQE